MANPFSQRARQRKLIYTVLILVLFTGSLMHRRLWIEPEAERLKLREAARGEVELTSSAVRLTLTGSRGLAVTFLWAAAIEQQEKHEWNELELLVGAITKLQPYFITPWLFQGWNLSYNVAVECDLSRDKYYYVSRGLKLLAEGERRNSEQGIGQPDLRQFIGVAYQGKLGITDEKNAMRSLLDLSCIDPVHRDPERFWTIRDGRNTINLVELAKFCRDHPRLVRRLREHAPNGLGYTQPKQIVDFLADNRDVPSRFEKPVGGAEQKETPLKKEPRDQFPILPPQPIEPPNPNLVDLGLGSESLDVFVVCRAWYTFAQQPLPPPTGDASLDEIEQGYDRLKYRAPKSPAMPIFRCYPARAQAYSAEILTDEGWFDHDGWLIKDWFSDDVGQGDEVRVGTEAKYHCGPAWDRAYRMYKEVGARIGLWFPVAEVRALDDKAEMFRKKHKITKYEGGPQIKPRNDKALAESWQAHQKLYWRGSINNLTNYEGHLGTAEAERTAEAVLGRKLFFHAERLRRYENDPERALALYEAAWPVWFNVLLRHPLYASQSSTQEDLYELQIKHQRLARSQRASQIKALTMGLAQLNVWPHPPLDDLLTAGDKGRIMQIRDVQGPLDWARLYDGPERDDLSRGLLAWTQAAGMPRLFLFPGQEEWTLLALDSRANSMQAGWRHLISDDRILTVKSRLGLIKTTPPPDAPTP
jgi:hypothetical protein